MAQRIGHWRAHTLNFFIVYELFNRRFWRHLIVFLLLPGWSIAGEAQNAFNDGIKFYKAAKYKTP